MIKRFLEILLFSLWLCCLAKGQSVNVGVTNILTQGTDAGNAGLIAAQQLQVGQAGVLQSISFYTVTAAGGQLILGLYDALSPTGGPGNLLASTNAFAAGDTSWNTTNVLTPVMLMPGTYWLACEVSSNDTSFPVERGTVGIHEDGVAPFGPLPSVFPAITYGPITSQWSFYATLNVGSPTPTPTPRRRPRPRPRRRPHPHPHPRRRRRRRRRPGSRHWTGTRPARRSATWWNGESSRVVPTAACRMSD